MRPSDVSAVIVTRGDVDLQPVLDSLIVEDVWIWNNSEMPNVMTFGRLSAMNACPNDIVFSIDDDIVHTAENQQRIIDAYEPGVLTGCMWSEWSDGAKAQGIDDGYNDLVFMGSGSVFHRGVPNAAVSAYLDAYPQDDFFHLWCDTIVGVVAPTKQLDIRFTALACAEDANRMCNLPNAVEQKTEAIRRARLVRDGSLVAA